ncbi:hypothetical protein BDV95DRAFT_599599 [Massariosphaeria phaeospora]|uniref:Apple domain-containing protein n=1 Tax=Massariosphaeria phaeospora TaxID=100035 RepID=A0A7C8M4Q4_9PLEO|nr:hypothetical protein BDV95DRAFT_599599 [Massariosphaeria phaeospora]
MVHFQSVSVLFAAVLLASKSVVAEEAHAVEIFPELKGKEGPFEVAYKEPDTLKPVVEEVDENGDSTIQKRGNVFNQDALTKLLKNHNGNGFCKGFCPGYDPAPVTQTNLKTSTKIVQATTTVGPPATTVTSTSTAKAPADVVITETATFSTTIATIIVADTSTITTTNTVSDVATVTSISTQTTTLGIPTSLPAPVRRTLNPPSWLKGFATNHICPACNKVWPPPPPKTVSVCKTTTRTSTQTRTFTKPGVTSTVVVTITPTAKAVTVSVSTTLTFSESSTSTPLTTTTLLSTVLATTTVASTVTETACAQQTAGVAGIGVNRPGSLRNAPASQVGECCTACYNTPGCNLWVYAGTNFCYYAVGGPPNVGDPTGQCPNGRGNGFLLEGEGGFGGPGPCSSA